ncbi:hypothetical protein K504DRAFT_279470 [Pleomassaria siparia CBS 279.74]|uniref:Uncharacterized protein n=1 Tax=Pleomassaria siparia CBS 279.74 TaxID=1314801 RepID=A0A6G1K9U6_9PLEO|nr:hypothetical protein K504DRAFT_279470 [Pleomassaria siparia CBS 279.74]
MPAAKWSRLVSFTLWPCKSLSRGRSVRSGSRRTFLDHDLAWHSDFIQSMYSVLCTGNRGSGGPMGLNIVHHRKLWQCDKAMVPYRRFVDLLSVDVVSILLHASGGEEAQAGTRDMTFIYHVHGCNHPTTSLEVGCEQDRNSLCTVYGPIRTDEDGDQKS